MAGAKAGNSNVMVLIKVMEDPHIFLPPGGYPQKQHQRSKPKFTAGFVKLKNHRRVGE